jgi:hypothetical protein
VLNTVHRKKNPKNPPVNKQNTAYILYYARNLLTVNSAKYKNEECVKHRYVYSFLDISGPAHGGQACAGIFKQYTGARNRVRIEL